MRAAAYSPNHIGNDAAILNAVASQLRKRGCEVNILSEDQFIAGGGNIPETVIINMCRDRRAIATLQALEEEGRLVINSGFGIENCVKERMTKIMMGGNIPYPESLIVDTDKVIKDTLKERGISQCWIKRADCHPMHKEDVSYVRHPEEAQEVLQEYFLRGINRAVISRHLTGDLVKFYGVMHQPFFYWFCPYVAGGGRYSCAEVNDAEAVKAVGQKIKKLSLSAAEELNVEIYGGDCIISPEGEVKIINFNDWPSYAPCRAEAASNIARRVMAAVKERKQGDGEKE